MTTDDIVAEVGTAVSRLWWIWLVAGIVWILVSVVILQFDTASAATVGLIFGLMLLAAGLQNLLIGSFVEEAKWFWYVFGGLLIVGGLVSLFAPVETFLALADILGFIFVMIGALWIVQALLARGISPLWWLGLVSGIIMVVMGFWLGGQFLITKAYTLLVFAGVYALMKGVTDLILAFEVRRFGKVLQEL